MFTCVSKKILPPRISCLGAIITPPRTSYINKCFKKGSLVGLQEFCKMSILHLSSYKWWHYPCFIRLGENWLQSTWRRWHYMCIKTRIGHANENMDEHGHKQWQLSTQPVNAGKAWACYGKSGALLICAPSIKIGNGNKYDPQNKHIFHIDSQCILVIMSTFSSYDKLLRLVLEDRHVWLICTEGLTIGIQPFLFICAVRS